MAILDRQSGGSEALLETVLAMVQVRFESLEPSLRQQRAKLERVPVK